MNSGLNIVCFCFVSSGDKSMAFHCPKAKQTDNVYNTCRSFFFQTKLNGLKFEMRVKQT